MIIVNTEEIEEKKARLLALGVISVSNPRHLIDGGIDCVCRFSDQPDISYPFSAHPDDPVEYGPIIYELCAAGVYGTVEPVSDERRKADEVNTLMLQLSSKKATADSRIAEVRRLCDEVEYGITADTTPSCREVMKAWVIYRKALEAFDVEAGGTLPKSPDE